MFTSSTVASVSDDISKKNYCKLQRMKKKKREQKQTNKKKNIDQHSIQISKLSVFFFSLKKMAEKALKRNLDQGSHTPIQGNKLRKIWLPTDEDENEEIVNTGNFGVQGIDYDDTEDYLSSSILQDAEKADKARIQQRKQREEKNPQKPLSEIMSETRQNGLEQKITVGNKGFELLKKMGYKEGLGLGRQSQGIVEPLEVAVKQGRKGLQSTANCQDGGFVTKSEFLEQKTCQYSNRKMESQVLSLQRVCEDLDQQAGIEFNHMWNHKTTQVEIDEFGQYAEEHKEDEESVKENEMIEDWRQLPVSKRLDELIDYVREKYCYCTFCGVQYEDKSDMEGNCPGRTEDDH